MKFQKGKILALMAALIVCLGVAAQAKLRETTLLIDYMDNGARYISGFEFQEETLYFIQGNVLGVLPQGVREPKEYPLSSIEGITDSGSPFGGFILLKEEEQLYLLDTQQGLLYELSLRDETPKAQSPVQFNWDSYVMDAGNGQTYVNAPNVFCVSGSRLFALERDMNTRIVSFSLADGSKTNYNAIGIEAMTAYKNGKLLALSQSDPMPGSYADTIAVFDPQEDSLTTLGTVGDGKEQNNSIFGFCYDADRDTLFIGLGQKITRFDALQDGIVCAVIPTGTMGSDSMRLISADQCGVLTPQGILIRSLDPDVMKSKETLSISGDLYANALAKTSVTMQDVNIIRYEPQSDTSMIGQMISGGADVDIFARNMQLYDFPAVRDKGYFSDLAQNAKLRNYVTRFYPFIRDTLGKDAKIAALPYSAILSDGYMYDTAFFEETGLAVPSTFEEMCDIIADWPQEYSAKYPQFQPVDMYEGPRQSLIRQALDLYMNHSAFSAREWRFDTPALRHLLTAAEETAALYPSVMEDSGEYFMLLFSSREQIKLSDYRGSGRDSRVVKPLFLSVDKESTAPVPLSLNVMLVNPHSTHLETSLRFLENTADNSDKILGMMLSPQEHRPLLNPNFDLWVDNTKEAIALTQKRIEETQGAEKREQEAMLERQKAGLLHIEQTERYLVDETALAAYKEDIKGGFLLMGGPESDAREAIRTIRERYADGQIDMDQFIKEADNKLRLVRLENQ